MLSRLTRFLALILTKCASALNLSKSAQEFYPSMTNTSHLYFGSPDSDDLVIFIHGLWGDARTTWTNATTHFIFPEELARDFAAENQPTYVVAFDYESRLQGGPSILSIADHLEFEIGELLKKHPYRRLRIVAHSMGGLVAREYILRRQHRAHPQLRITNIVILATPNNGSELSELGRHISGNRQVEELRHIDKGNTYLESLNKDWNREFKGAGHPRHVLLYAGYEELAVPVLGQIVKLSSAVPYADESMGFQEDHVSIAKPKERNVLYRWVQAKLGESLEKTARQLLNGMVHQGLLQTADISQRLTRTVELLEELQALSGTELEKVLVYVKAGQFKAALALLAENELKESQLIENIAQRRFTQGEIYELQFQMVEAASYYSQAVQLAPTNGWFRERYGSFLIDTGNSRSAILQLLEVVHLSRTTHNSHLENAALASLGIGYVNIGQYDKAIECFEQALAISRLLADERGEGASLVSLGNTYAHLGQYAKAAELHEQALAISRKIGDERGEGASLGNLGNAYAHLGQGGKAIEHYEHALVIHRKIEDIQGMGTGLRNLGHEYSHLGQHAKAIELHEQALALHRKIGDVHGEADTLGSLGNAYGDTGQNAKAIELHEQALALRRKIGDVQGETVALGNMGLAYARLGQHAKATELHKQALAICRKIGDVEGEKRALGNLGLD